MGEYEEFLLERLGCIGGSDASILTGSSEYTTPYQLWLQKTNRVPISTSRAAPAIRGTNLEPVARAAYEIEHGDFESYEAVRMVDPEYDFLAANLDGFNHEKKRILEIKCPFSRDRHLNASNGDIPENYRDQIQFQLMVTPQALDAHYFSYDDGSISGNQSGFVVRVERDQEWLAKWRPYFVDWWQSYVVADCPPPLTDKDWKTVDDAEALELFKYLYSLKSDASLYKKERLRLSSRVKNLFDKHHSKIVCGEFKCSKNKRGWSLKRIQETQPL